MKLAGRRCLRLRTNLLESGFLGRLNFELFPCAVADVENVNGVAVYGKKDAVTADAFSVKELPYFLLEEVIFGRMGTAFWKYLQGINDGIEAVKPLHGTVGRTLGC